MTPTDLRAMVAVMRELGVISCDGIQLGPEPPRAQPDKRVPKTPAEMEAAKVAELEAAKADEEQEKAAKAEYERILFAAS